MLPLTDITSSHQLQLKNGAQVLLLRQPSAAKTCVSAAFKAGHFFDPKTCQGLAHLLEHMLFMGSRHLPKPNALNDLVGQHGGTINAWTGTEFSNFHFDCHHDAIESVLPFFADMLCAPLLVIDSVEQECKAINAEFEFKRKDDLRRLYQIHKETCNPEHPFAKFSVGNEAIFARFTAQALQQQLKQFHQQHYCGNNLQLVIVSPHSAEQLLPLIENTFGRFEPGSKPATDWPPLYRPQDLGIQIDIEPLQSARRLIVTFALPPLQHDLGRQPLAYLSHLLGDEGNGSLLAVLKRREWVTNLIAGSGIEGENFKDFNVNLQLSESGLNHVDDIISIIFGAIRLIKESLHESWRFDEKHKLTLLAHEHSEQVKPLELACELAEKLFYHSYTELAEADFKETYSVDVMLATLSHFTAQNMRVKVIAPEVNTNQQCLHYEANYRVSRFSDETIERWQQATIPDELQLPPPNPYLGVDYSLVSAPTEQNERPIQLVDQDGFAGWFLQDSEFRIPKGDIYLALDCPGFTESIQAVAAKRIWLAALNDQLQSQFYRAEIAGLHYRIYGQQGGFSIHTRGFSAQQTTLLQSLLEQTMQCDIDEAVFYRMQRQQQQMLYNSLLNKPTNRLFSRLSVLIQRNTHAPIELLEAISELKFAECQKLIQHGLSGFSIESLMHGNWHQEDAQKLFEDIRMHYAATGQLGDQYRVSRHVARLAPGNTLYHEVNCQHDDAAVVLYLQAPSAELYDTALCMVLEQLLAAPFFNVLRTEQQLGYVVGTGYIPHNQHPGMAFYIQSPTHNAEHLLNAISEFLLQQLHEISFYATYWPRIKANILKQLQEHDANLAMKSQRLWLSLGNKDEQFCRQAKLATLINQLEFPQIVDYARQLASRRKFGELILFANGKLDSLNVSNKRTLHDISQFKATANYII